MNLNDSVTEIKSISAKSAQLLEKLEIATVRDLLTYFPVRYLDTSNTTLIKDLILNDNVEDLFLIKATLSEFKSSYIPGGKTIQRGLIEDQSGNIQVAWFNQKFLQNALKVDNEYLFYGRLNKKGNRYTFYPRTFEKVGSSDTIHLGRIVPEYKLTNGISKKVFRRWMHNAIEEIEKIEVKDELSEFTDLKLELKRSLSIVHFPENFTELDSALSTLSIYELVNIYLKLAIKREQNKGLLPPIIPSSFNADSIFTLLQSLIHFELTPDQEKIIKNILINLKNQKLINEIVQGDVGTGKTIIAVAACLAMAVSGYQSAVLAPTTILAEQHYNTFNKLLEKLKITVELVSSTNKDSKPAQILVGTSAVLARKQSLIKNLGLVIVDEQHKFGVKQREELLNPLNIKLDTYYPHFINMTATPIPRTISQVIFGDVEMEVLSTKPKGRLPIKTLLVPEEKRTDSYEWVKKALQNGDQVYWICPLIIESEKLQVKSAQETFLELSEYFEGFKVGLLHGKLKEHEKADIMQKFSNKEINLLVSTSVIEVGIDVPNASIIIIESSERFGLAQLHQIRGRVGRGEKQSWCLLFYSNNISERSLNRLKFITNNSNGLEIAEYDLLNRGPGEIYGTAQSGLPDLKIAKLDNLDTIKLAKDISQKLLERKIFSIDLFK